jgi:endoglucanase
VKAGRSGVKARRATLVLCLLFAATDARASGDQIRLNTVGFLPGHDKRASVAARCTEFTVVRAKDGASIFRGRMTGPAHNEDTNEDLCTADFSTLDTPGVYQLDVPGVGRSVPFRISRAVYDEPFAVAVRAMHLWRCGAAVRVEYEGQTYEHAACHLDDAWLDFVGGGHTRRASPGGWHDAGDYNKYVVNAGVTVGTMLLAWEQFGARIERIDLRLSADTQRPHDSRQSLPAYLDEVKWELDWLLTMQAADGSVYHKVSTRDFGPAIMPEDEKTPRFFAPWSSAATADFAAMTAEAARVFRRYDQSYSDRLLAAARRSYVFLQTHTESHPADLRGFTTGAYQTADVDDRLWAAAELWETTGDAACLADFETRARAYPDKFALDWGWSNVQNLGELTYLFSRRPGRDARLVEEVRRALLQTADEIVRRRDAHGYARTLGTRYYWGANGAVANTVVLLQSADRLSPKRAYVESSLDALGNLFGRNCYARSFVTGLGANPPLHPHDRRVMSQPGGRAWPGYLVGGGWPRATDWADVSANYRVNEIAINWNAPLIYALASFISAPVR